MSDTHQQKDGWVYNNATYYAHNHWLLWVTKSIMNYGHNQIIKVVEHYELCLTTNMDVIGQEEVCE